MRNAIVVGIFCLVLGFAAGWVARPGKAGEGGPSGQIAAGKPERRAAGDQAGGKLATKTGRPMESGSDDEKSEGPRAIVIANGEVVEQDDEAMEEVRKVQDRWQKAMVDRQIRMPG